MHGWILAGLGVTAAIGGAAEPVAKEWRAGNGTVVRYRWAEPEKPEDGKKYPLVLFLHGAGERGVDNTAQLKHGALPLLKGAEKLGEACFLIAPQCPPDEWWAQPSEDRSTLKAANEPNPLLEAVLELVETLKRDHPIDTSRFYVTGLSMGGFGTWDLLGRAPEQIAAAIPICGGGEPAQAERFKDIPVWAFHGEADQVVPVSSTRIMIKALEAAGGMPKVTIYPDVQHDSWTATYADQELIRWMFDQKQPAPAP